MLDTICRAFEGVAPVGLLQAAAVSAALSCFGCGGGTAVQTAPPELPKPDDGGQYDVELPAGGEYEARSIQLELGAEFQECDVDAPHFRFDSAKLRPQDAEQLRRLSECLNAEPFKDTRLILVGRTDPTGTQGYNRALGLERAQAVKHRLVETGIEASRIGVTSLGEQDTKAGDERYADGFDRRVSIIQLGIVHP